MVAKLSMKYMSVQLTNRSTNNIIMIIIKKQKSLNTA